jgi:hypothetical protein
MQGSQTACLPVAETKTGALGLTAGALGLIVDISFSQK